MAEYEDMDDFLKGEPLETEPEVETQEETQQAEEPTDEETDSTTSVEEESQPEQPQEPEQPQVDVEKLVAERNAFKYAMEQERLKRQQMEQPKEPEKEPDFWEQENPAEFVKQQIRQEVEAVKAENQQRILNLSESAAKARYDDYDDKFQVFAQMVQRDPTVYQQMLQQPDPAEYAYKAANKLIQMQEMGDPEAFKQKVLAETKDTLKAELRAELEAELKAEYEQKLKAASLPGSFSEAQSKNTPKGSFAGPTSLESILN